VVTRAIISAVCIRCS